VAFRGKSSWISIIGSTVTEGVLHAEQVTVEVRAPAKVWSWSSACGAKGLIKELTGYTITARHLTFCSSVHLIKRGQEEGMRIYPLASLTSRCLGRVEIHTLLTVPLELCTSVPHGIQHRNRSPG
jgi:hypothetical protein